MMKKAIFLKNEKRGTLRDTHASGLVGKIIGGVRIFLLLVSLVLFFSQFLLAGELSTRGSEIAELSSKLDKVKLENQLLENKLAEVSSLSYVRTRAEQELGMRVSEFEFLSSERLAQLPH